MDWSQVLQSIGIFAVGSGILAVLIRSILKSILAKDLEKFKAELSKENEKFKSDLHQTAVEHEIRFERLHTKRAEVIENLYHHLVEASWAAGSFLSLMEWAGEPSKQEKYKEAMLKITGLFRYFDKHRIYLSQEHCSTIDKFVDELREPSIEFSVYLDTKEYDSAGMKQKIDVWTKAYKRVKENIPPARKIIEDEFRNILGVSH